MDLKRLDCILHVHYRWLGHQKNTAFPSLAQQWTRKLYAEALENSIFLLMAFPDKVKREEAIIKKNERERYWKEGKMRRFRQWLAETEDHMTESPDGTYYLVSDVEKMEAEKDRVLQESCVILAEGIKVVENLEQQIAALKTAVKEKDEIIEAFEAMKEGITDRVSDLEAAVHEWQDIAGQWEDKCQKLTEQIARLIAELECYKLNPDEAQKLISQWQKRSFEFEDENVNLTAENKRLFEEGIAIMHDQGAENILLKEENKRLAEEITELRSRLRTHGDIKTDEEEDALK